MRGKKLIIAMPAILLASLVLSITSCSSTTTDEVQNTTTSMTPPVTTTPTTITETSTPPVTTSVISTSVPINTTSITPVTVTANISAADAYTLIQANLKNPNFIIIDVRTAEEFDQGHLKGAINIDYESSTFKEDIGKLDRDFTYLVYCRTGVRSGMAQGIMEEAGFKHVTSLIGGITEWIAQGFEVVK